MFSAMTTGLLEPEHASRDEPIAGADVRTGVDDEEHGVDVVEGGIDGLLHALGERVHRALEARQVDERELVVGAVGDAEDPTAGRVGDGRRDRDLLAAESVDERRLADVRAAGDATRPDFTLQTVDRAFDESNDSGSSSSGVIVTTRPPLRKTTRSTPISCSHCRQPPHGDAVIAATAKSPGR